MNRKELERAAVAAYRRGDGWLDFWRDCGPSIRAAEPICQRRYHKLTDTLLALVVSGNTIGHVPIDDDDVMPWEHDDQPEPSDVTTAATIQTSFPRIVEGTP